MNNYLPFFKAIKAFIMMAVVIYFLYGLIGYKKMHDAFALFDSKTLTGHIQHVSQRGHGQYFNLIEDSGIYYFTYLSEIDAHVPVSFNSIVSEGDSIFKPKGAFSLQLFKADGVHTYIITK